MDWYVLSDKALVSKIGERLRQKRLEQNITQKELAERAGVAVSSVAGVEQGKNISLLTLVALLRALQALHLLELFLQEPEISPIAYARMLEGEKTRHRASGGKIKKEKDNVGW